MFSAQFNNKQVFFFNFLILLLNIHCFKSSNQITFTSAKEGTPTWNKSSKYRGIRKILIFRSCQATWLCTYTIYRLIYIKRKTGKIIPLRWLGLYLCNNGTSFLPPTPSLICQWVLAQGISFYPKNSAPPGTTLNLWNDNGLETEEGCMRFFHFFLLFKL